MSDTKKKFLLTAHQIPKYIVNFFLDNNKIGGISWDTYTPSVSIKNLTTNETHNLSWQHITEDEEGMPIDKWIAPKLEVNKNDIIKVVFDYRKDGDTNLYKHKSISDNSSTIISVQNADNTFKITGNGTIEADEVQVHVYVNNTEIDPINDTIEGLGWFSTEVVNESQEYCDLLTDPNNTTKTYKCYWNSDLGKSYEFVDNNWQYYDGNSTRILSDTDLYLYTDADKDYKVAYDNIIFNSRNADKFDTENSFIHYEGPESGIIRKLPQSTTEINDVFLTRGGILGYSLYENAVPNLQKVYVPASYEIFMFIINSWNSILDVDTDYGKITWLCMDFANNYNVEDTGVQFIFTDGITKNIQEIINDYMTTFKNETQYGEETDNYIDYVYMNGGNSVRIGPIQFSIRDIKTLVNTWKGDKLNAKSYTIGGNTYPFNRKYFTSGANLNDMLTGGALGEGELQCQAIVLPNTVTKLTSRIFNTSILAYIGINNVTPPEIDVDCFNDKLVSILVPTSSVETYKTTENWSKYADKIIGYDFNA